MSPDPFKPDFSSESSKRADATLARRLLRERLDAYFDREVSNSEAKILLHDLLQNPEMLDDAADEQTVIDEIRATRDIPSTPDVTNRVLQDLGLEISTPHTYRSRFISRWKLRSAMAAAIVLGLTVGLWIRTIGVDQGQSERFPSSFSMRVMQPLIESITDDLTPTADSFGSVGNVINVFDYAKTIVDRAPETWMRSPRNSDHQPVQYYDGLPVIISGFTPNLPLSLPSHVHHEKADITQTEPTHVPVSPSVIPRELEDSEDPALLLVGLV